MKRCFNSFKIAFSMYSKIPVPQADWNQENMQYAIAFFPLIGLVIGAFIVLWGKVLSFLPFTNQLGTIVYVLIPVLITGGIHVDGFLDVSDARHSYQPVEKKLEIMKDPHTGAFAIISAIVYFLAAVGIWSEVTLQVLPILAVGYVMSRSLSGFSVVTFPMAKKDGLAAGFAEAARKRRVRNVLIVYYLLCCIAVLWMNPFLGAIQILISLLVFGYYYRFSMKQFGGMTGDLAGYFLQLCELFMAGAVIVAGNLI